MKLRNWKIGILLLSFSYICLAKENLKKEGDLKTLNRIRKNIEKASIALKKATTKDKHNDFGNARIITGLTGANENFGVTISSSSLSYHGLVLSAAIAVVVISVFGALLSHHIPKGGGGGGGGGYSAPSSGYGAPPSTSYGSSSSSSFSLFKKPKFNPFSFMRGSHTDTHPIIFSPPAIHPSSMSTTYGHAPHHTGSFHHTMTGSHSAPKEHHHQVHHPPHQQHHHVHQPHQTTSSHHRVIHQPPTLFHSGFSER